MISFLAALSGLTPALSRLAVFLLPLAQVTDDLSNQQPQVNPVASAMGGVIGLLFVIIGIVSMWKLFTKAGQPGWASIIPIYNLYILCKISGKPGWWLILMFIPFVNFIILILLFLGLAKSFGKGAGFGLGLVFLGIIFLPILAFGDARYQGPTPPALP